MRRPYPLLFALCVPLVFLHATYQPSATLSVGGSDATLYLSDVAVLAAGAVGLAAGFALGFAPLRAAPAVWISSAAVLALVLLGTALGPVLTDGYPFVKHALTAAKFAEYALLALAAPLAIRTLEELTPLLVALVAWSAAATFGAVLQFLGLWNEFEGRRPGQREPSFLGIHDLAALSGAALSLGLIAIALGRYRRLGLAGGLSGGLGMILSGATTAVSGIAAAAVAAWLLGRRRALASGSTPGSGPCGSSAPGSSRSGPSTPGRSSTRSGSSTRVPRRPTPRRAGSSGSHSPTSAAGSSSTTRCSASAGRPRIRP